MSQQEHRQPMTREEAERQVREALKPLADEARRLADRVGELEAAITAAHANVSAFFVPEMEGKLGLLRDAREILRSALEAE